MILHSNGNLASSTQIILNNLLIFNSWNLNLLIYWNFCEHMIIFLVEENKSGCFFMETLDVSEFRQTTWQYWFQDG